MVTVSSIFLGFNLPILLYYDLPPIQNESVIEYRLTQEEIDLMVENNQFEETPEPLPFNDNNDMRSYYQTIMLIMNSLKWKYVDFDKAFWNQCVDLIRWIFWTFWIWFWDPVVWAVDFAWQSIEWFTWVPNDDIYAFPEAWSVVIFDKTKKNPYWHIVYVLPWTTWRLMKALEQNVWIWGWKQVASNSVRVSWLSYLPTLWRWKCLWWFVPNENTKRKMMAFQNPNFDKVLR